MARGLPIGNLTSQFFANLYLNELDYFVKFDMRRRYYLRYMDDFLIFGNDKEELAEFKTRIMDFLKNRLALNLHEGKSQIYKTKDGIKFLGFRMYRDYRRLASDNLRRFRKRLKRFAYLLENGRIDAKEISDSVRCWAAHSKYADTGALRHRIFNGLANDKMKGLLKDILLGRREEKMKKLAIFATLIIFFCTLYPEPCPLAHAADGKYKGGAGNGYASNKYTGRIDGSDSRRPAARPLPTPEVGKQGKGNQYHGGQGSGYSSAQYTGRIDAKKKQSRT